ncbi:MAG: DNA topoisomerase IB [Verrucomicrobiota bacterium JB023]|nr:DNA topoisomerase IB [Verrucomicrobiota bacterium JB023]
MKLIRSSDTEPGFRRQRCGRGFTYLTPDGDRLGKGEDLERIRSLAIPPAYQSVWICLSPLGHLQATGRDSRSRKQYRYHPSWLQFRNEQKFDSLLDFARHLPSLRAETQKILRRKTLDEETVTALALSIIDRTGARVGNEHYREDNGTFGITTLAKEHAELHGRTIELNYRGKHGKDVTFEIDHPGLARHLAKCHELPGEHLFEYRNEEGELAEVDSGMVNQLIKELSADEFSAKTFRTWRGTLLAFRYLLATDIPDTKKSLKSTEVAAVKAASKALFNTQATCRKYYIHPLLLNSWLDQTFAERLRKAKRSRAFQGMRTKEESLLARFLKES